MPEKGKKKPKERGKKMNDEVDYPVSELFYSKTSESSSIQITPNRLISFLAVPDKEYFQHAKVISVLESIGILMRKKTPGKKKGVRF